MSRGSIFWASLPQPRGSESGFKRPVLVISSDAFNASRIHTVTVAAITSNLRLAAAPGNVSLTPAVSGLPRESVINVSQILTLDREFLGELVGELSADLVRLVDRGLALALDLRT